MRLNTENHMEEREKLANEVEELLANADILQDKLT